MSTSAQSPHDAAIFDAVAKKLCDALDWNSPILCDSDARRALDAGQPAQATLAAVRYIRTRKSPVTPYPADTIRTLLAAATPAQIEASRTALATLWRDLPDQTRLVYAMRTTSMFDVLLGATPAVVTQLTAATLAVSDHWHEWVWYPTLALCKILQPALGHDAFSDADILILLAHLATAIDREWQGERDWDEIMFGINGHNYFVTGFGGLATAGVLFPELLPCAKFQGFAQRFVDTHTLQLFQPDGFTHERSGYHWGTVEELSAVAHLVRINGGTLSDAAEQRLAACHSAGGWKLTTPDAGVPCNGDTGARHQGGSGGNLRIAAVLANDPASKFVAEAITPDWKPSFGNRLLHHGENLLPAYERIIASPPPGPAHGADTSLPHSGYYVMRREWSRNTDWALIDAGARGNVVTSHDHGGVFNLELFAHGTPALLDNCSGHYGWAANRQWRKSAHAHNVATVDDEPHLPPRNEWRWAARLQPTVEAWITTDQYAYFSGAHEAYDRLEKPVACRRKLFYLRGRYWILIDRFTTARDANHTYRQHFNPRAGATLLADGRAVTKGPDGNLLIVGVPGLTGGADLRANPHPLEGYDNPDSLTFTKPATGNTLMATLLVPFLGNAIPDVIVAPLPVLAAGQSVTPFEVTALEITVNGQRGVYVDQHMYWTLPWSAGGYTGDHRVFHS